ncbi:hypothetical protein SEA_SPEEDDEMON_1230 [Gordonia phage SpeedDemon]|nr:hypothetical protein SEA_SPEEDDEMON_1230 [Gordonia phage SpeedDemon]
MRRARDISTALMREYDRVLDNLFAELAQILGEYDIDESEWIAVVANELPGDIADAFEEWMAWE